MKKLLPALCFVLLFATSVFAQDKLSREFIGIKKIRISTSSGDCKLVKGSGNKTAVDLQHTFGDSFKPEMTQEGDRLVIKEHFSQNTSHGNAKWTIAVPDGVEVKYSTGSGTIDVSNLSLDLDINTGSGDIILSQIKGDVKGTTGSGDIEVTDFNGEINTTTGSGSIDMRRSSGEIKANCGSGNILLADSKASFSVNTGSGKVSGRNISLEGASSFNAGSGDVEVVLAASPGHDISVNSGSGDAKLDFNGNAIAGEVVMKANKRNGEIRAPFEFDKTEEIEQGRDQITVKKTAVKGNANVKISVGTGSGAAIIR